MMTNQFIQTEEVYGIGIIILNRPEKYNAMHGPLISELLNAITRFAKENIRVLIIRANGENFCVGGDIYWMQKMGEADQAENESDAARFAEMLYQLYSFPHPTIVLAQGLTLGGGLGLLSAADIAVVTNNAMFQLPEVKIGLTPSIISPYVVACIGPRAASFYFLTGNRFDANEAKAIGLIHQITDADSLLNKGMMIAESLREGSSAALQSAKALIRRVAFANISKALSQEMGQHLAKIRSTKEAQEGLRAFLENRKPNKTSS